ncbi:MAG: DNA damage-inducible protein D [Planctomycetota bacterium]|nr:DNA damage-inducible protein D [Planctomycetota bacterium]MDA1214290.1 DNA damage-inducible protein D [Planctomycetota bacterium]
MKPSVIAQLHKDFEALVKIEEESGIEFWLARNLQEILGYTKWENFSKVIQKARMSCMTAGYDESDHFLDVRKMVAVGSGAQREIDDLMLTRYACYLIAQNGDPSKDAIAFAQSYFAVQTRKQEIIEQRLVEVERLQARKKLTASEKQLSGLIFEKLNNNQSFGRIRSQGDMALFGGKTTQQMKNKLKVPTSRALADFLPTIVIKAKDFANEITTFNIKRDDLNSEDAITYEHVKNNADVRKLLGKRNIRPESLPAAEDAKKVERRMKADERKLSESKNSLEHKEGDE